MSLIKFIKELFAKRKEHVETVKQIEKEIAEVLEKAEPIKKKAKKKPTKKKPNGPK